MKGALLTIGLLVNLLGVGIGFGDLGLDMDTFLMAANGVGTGVFATALCMWRD